MDVFEKIVIEFSINEVIILRKAIQGFSPLKEDEMIAFMLYTRLTNKVKEVSKNESP